MIVRHRYPVVRTFDRTFDQTFEQLTRSFFEPRTPTRRTLGPVVEQAWDGDTYVLTVDLPGVPAEAVSVDVTGSTLTLGANTEALSWEQSLRLASQLDADSVSARHVDGRLTVRIATVARPEPRRVEIDTSPAQPAPVAEIAESTEPATDDAGDDT